MGRSIQTKKATLHQVAIILCFNGGRNVFIPNTSILSRTSCTMQLSALLPNLVKYSFLIEPFYACFIFWHEMLLHIHTQVSHYLSRKNLVGLSLSA